MAALAGAPLRYSDISRTLAGISPKMLTQSLRSLERDGVLTRTVTPSVPVRVDYELTELGASLAELTTAIKAWAETHIEEVRSARERYDASRRAPDARKPPRATPRMRNAPAGARRPQAHR